MDPLAEKYYSISPYAYCGGDPVNFVDPDGRDGIATIDYDNKTIAVSQTFYYNNNSEALYRKAIVADREINNFRDGHQIIPSEISLLSQDGFSSREWSINDGSTEWTVSFSYEFIGLDSDDDVANALSSHPEANALCYDDELKSDGVWDPSTRTLTLGFKGASFGSERGTTLKHEIGHSWGLPHENLMPSSPIYGQENENGSGIMSYGKNRTIQQYEVEYGVGRILKDIPANHPSSIKKHIKTGNY